MNQEIEKVNRLIASTQQQIDSAKSDKAPQGTIEHLQEREKALNSRLKRFKTALAKMKQPRAEGQKKVKKKTASSSGKKDDKTPIQDGDE